MVALTCYLRYVTQLRINRHLGLRCERPAVSARLQMGEHARVLIARIDDVARGE